MKRLLMLLTTLALLTGGLAYAAGPFTALSEDRIKDEGSGQVYVRQSKKLDEESYYKEQSPADSCADSIVMTSPDNGRLSNYAPPGPGEPCQLGGSQPISVRDGDKLGKQNWVETSPGCPSGGVRIGVSIQGDDKCVGSADENPILAYARQAIKFISGIFGLAVVFVIILSGIQYITSAGNPDAVKEAKSRLTNAIVGLVLFILMFGILNYLIPGGIFK